jgi:hypothetical protein
MTTAEAVAKVSSGQFELLASSVLRQTNPLFTELINTGINEKGQTIKDPVDGLGLVYGSNPPHYVAVAHTTTTKKSQLKAKWIKDIEGAVEDLKELVGSASGAQLTVALTSSKHVSSELLKSVYKRAAELQVKLVPLEQSRIADHLDNTPSGQWLRWKFCHIEAEQLSIELLQDLCEKSLENFRNNLLGIDLNLTVERDAVASIKDSNKTLHLLVGRSGFGKSTLTFQALMSHAERGGFSLWFPADEISNRSSFESALGDTLLRLHPRLMADSGKTALRILSEQRSLLIAVDDINRVSDPVSLLRALIAWTRPHSAQPSESGSGGKPPNFAVICPCWHSTLDALGLDLTKPDWQWLHLENLEQFTDQEARAALNNIVSHSGKSFSITETDEIAERLGHDPYLITTWGNLFQTENLADTPPEALIQRYIETKLRELVAQGKQRSLGEFQSALTRLAHEMLIHRNLNPLFTDISTWFSENRQGLDALRELARDGKICFLSGDSYTEFFRFRHDRLAEVPLSDAMAALLKNKQEYSEIIADPYFANIVGYTLARFPQEQETLEWLMQESPPALAEALRLIGEPRKPHHIAIKELLKTWFEQNHANPDTQTFIWSVKQSLMHTDSSAVLEITQPLAYKNDRLVNYARLRNGDAIGGVSCCVWGSGYAFFFNDPTRDSAIEVALHRHGETFIHGLNQFLKRIDIDDRLRKAALSFAGFVKSPDLYNGIQSCCQNSNISEILAESLWAVLRCYTIKAESLLEQLLGIWVDLSSETNNHGTSQQNAFSNEFRGSLAWGIPQEAILALTRANTRYPQLSWLLLQILSRVDHPDALDFCVHEIAEGASQDWGLT